MEEGVVFDCRPHVGLPQVEEGVAFDRLPHLGLPQEEEGVARGRWPGGQGAEPDAARAVDAAGHDGLDERPDVLVLDGALAAKVAVGEPGPVGAEGHGLVLQVTLPALRVEGWRRWEEGQF